MKPDVMFTETNMRISPDTFTPPPGRRDGGSCKCRRALREDTRFVDEGTSQGTRVSVLRNDEGWKTKVICTELKYYITLISLLSIQDQNFKINDEHFYNRLQYGKYSK